MTTTNIRVPIGQLVAACRTLGEVRVMAAGSLYATLQADEEGMKQLTKAGITWAFD